MQLESLGYLGWFLMGVSVGFGPCVSHHFLVLLPYIGAISTNARNGLIEVFSFFTARLVAYGALGAAAAATGRAAHRAAAGQFSALGARMIFGVLLLALALITLFSSESAACSRLYRRLARRPGRAMALAGVLVALTPCPILLGLLGTAAASGAVSYGAISGLIFATGSALSPLLVAGPLLGLANEKLTAARLAGWSRTAGGLLLFAYGVHLLVSSWL